MTGASRGLGLAVAHALGEAGYTLCLTYRTSGDKAREAAAHGAPGSFALPFDATARPGVDSLADEVRERWGALDALVLNAAITSDALLPRLEEGDWDRTIAANVGANFLLIRALAPLMPEGGHIVTVSSRSGLRGNAGQAAYSAAKAALMGLTLSAARELAPRIRVNSVVPGYMETDMGRAAPRAMERARGESLLSALTPPAEVAGFVLWLLGTRHVTGQVFTIDSRI